MSNTNVTVSDRIVTGAYSRHIPQHAHVCYMYVRYSCRRVECKNAHTPIHTHVHRFSLTTVGSDESVFRIVPRESAQYQLWSPLPELGLNLLTERNGVALSAPLSKVASGSFSLHDALHLDEVRISIRLYVREFPCVWIYAYG